MRNKDVWGCGYAPNSVNLVALQWPKLIEFAYLFVDLHKCKSHFVRCIDTAVARVSDICDTVLFRAKINLKQGLNSSISDQEQ